MSKSKRPTTPNVIDLGPYRSDRNNTSHPSGTRRPAGSSDFGTEIIDEEDWEVLDYLDNEEDGEVRDDEEDWEILDDEEDEEVRDDEEDWGVLDNEEDDSEDDPP